MERNSSTLLSLESYKLKLCIVDYAETVIKNFEFFFFLEFITSVIQISSISSVCSLEHFLQFYWLRFFKIIFFINYLQKNFFV